MAGSSAPPPQRGTRVGPIDALEVLRDDSRRPTQRLPAARLDGGLAVLRHLGYVVKLSVVSRQPDAQCCSSVSRPCKPGLRMRLAAFVCRVRYRVEQRDQCL